MSAFNAMRTLHGEIENRLSQNEDFRVLKALEKALREVARPGTPQARMPEFGFATSASQIPVASAPGTPVPSEPVPTGTGKQDDTFKFGASAA